MQIEGIRDGWEFLGVRYANFDETVIDDNGTYQKWKKTHPSSRVYPIVRKIIKQKYFREFANAKEADSLWNAVLKFKNPESGLEDSRFRVNYITGGTVGIGNGSYSYENAFEYFECIDGTPFGIEIQD